MDGIGLIDPPSLNVYFIFSCKIGFQGLKRDNKELEVYLNALFCTKILLFGFEVFSLGLVFF